MKTIYLIFRRKHIQINKLLRFSVFSRKWILAEGLIVTWQSWCRFEMIFEGVPPMQLRCRNNKYNQNRFEDDLAVPEQVQKEQTAARRLFPMAWYWFR